MNPAHPTAEAIDRWLRDCAGQPGAQPPADNRLCRVLKFIGSRLTDRPDLDAIAAAAGIPRRTLTWLVRRELGCSVGEIVTWLRLRRAMRALSEADRPITDVALESGYSSANKMANHFTRYLGVSPRDYRAQVVKNCRPRSTPSLPAASPTSLATGKRASNQASHS